MSIPFTCDHEYGGVIPFAPRGVEKTYGEGVIKKVQQALISIKDSAILSAFPRSNFIAADNAMYKPILDTTIEVGIIRQ